MTEQSKKCQDPAYARYDNPSRGDSSHGSCPPLSPCRVASQQEAKGRLGNICFFPETETRQSNEKSIFSKDRSYSRVMRIPHRGYRQWPRASRRRVRLSSFTRCGSASASLRNDPLQQNPRRSMSREAQPLYATGHGDSWFSPSKNTKIHSKFYDMSA